MGKTDRTAPKTYYVYTYAYPDGSVFYVGKGTKGRIDGHEHEAERGCQCRKCETIRQIWASGKTIQKRIVYETLDELDALEQEQNLISAHAGPYLTNIKDNLYRAQSRYHREYTGELAAALEKDIINARLVGLMLGVTPRTVIRLANRGEIPGF